MSCAGESDLSLIKRIVFDTSTLISAVLRPTSIPRQAFQQAIATAELCASPATLAELETVLTRDKFERYLDLDTRMAFFALYKKHVRLYAVTAEDEAKLPQACRDPRDDKFLALALACSANFLVTSDEDLLVLHPYQTIPLVLPKDFLTR